MTRATCSDDKDCLTPLIRHLRRLGPLSGEEEAAIRGLPVRIEEAGEGALLTRAGRIEEECVLLVSAFASKHRVTPHGHKEILAVNLPGEIVNVRHALAQETEYDCSVWRGGRIARIPAEDFRETIFNTPGLARALWLYTHAEGAFFREWLLNPARHSLHAKVAHLLCDIAVRLALVCGSEPAEVLIPTSAGQLARAAGTVSLYAERALLALEARGAIRLEDDGIRVADWDRLVREGDYEEAQRFEPLAGESQAAGAAQPIH